MKKAYCILPFQIQAILVYLWHQGYLLLGCDGVWERFTNQHIVDFLLKRPGLLV